MKSFIFESYNFDTKTKVLNLNYSFDSKLFFTEKITFDCDRELNVDEIGALNNVFKYLHIIAGISYYKLFLPKNIKIKTMDLNKQQALFFNKFYLNGLGEFSYRNSVYDLKERINFPFNNKETNKPIKLKLQNRYCIPVGGGKDSIVSIEIMKNAVDKKDIILGSVNTAQSIEETIKIAGLDNFCIKREISPKLLEVNADLEKYGAYNGHVPITGILAFVLCAGSIIYGYDTVLVSNERSANVGNVKFAGLKVNHQWSKSFQAEKMLNTFFKKFVLTDFNYVSFLRPLSEIHIAKIFSKLTQYHKIFKSCNKNFKINGRINNWCCNCDKCRFVFLILATFMKKEELVEIFCENLLDDKEQLKGYLELVGLENFKPFECVGEIDESRYAILNIDKSFEDSYIVKTIRTLLSERRKREITNLFTLDKKHLLNETLFGYLNNYIK